MTEARVKTKENGITENKIENNEATTETRDNFNIRKIKNQTDMPYT